MNKLNFINTAINNLLEINKVLRKNSTYRIDPLEFNDELTNHTDTIPQSQIKIDFNFLKVNTISKTSKSISFVEQLTRIFDDETITDLYKYMIFVFKDHIDVAFSKIYINGQEKIAYSNIVKLWKLPLTFEFDDDFAKATYDRDAYVIPWKIHIFNVLNKISTSTFEVCCFRKAKEN